MAETKIIKPKKDSALTYYEAVGRCSEAVARVRAYFVKKGIAKIGEVEHKAGAFIVNGKTLAKAFPLLTDQMVCQKPLKITESTDRFVISVKVSGGGVTGQIGAIAHGLAHALSLEPTGADRMKMRASGHLTRDARTRERRMVGTGGKSRRLKQSPKR
ncbi:MAG: 30S ribosomal protein S9 [Candidatus Roizmanbacteria bacterium]